MSAIGLELWYQTGGLAGDPLLEQLNVLGRPASTWACLGSIETSSGDMT